ncbi:Hypothetical protein LOCK908_0946 [Lacticaseibacillus rhamnosus LOCK908]|nr:hypothetical protein LRHK_908 [Lacticaseibacillus rhamnosus ATCC 8530]AGP73591.1 Hypothetical protein LOCK908_0946 [Lacticaseibacillus rhamnosus LOCK908]
MGITRFPAQKSERKDLGRNGQSLGHYGWGRLCSGLRP